MNFEIVEYQQSYINDVISLWNKTLSFDLINQERFYNRIVLDDNFKTNYFLLAIEDNCLIGFVFGIKRQIPYLERGLESERAWINIIAVDEERQRQGVGTALVNEVEKRFIEDGVKEITLCAYSPNYLTPGIDKRYHKGIHFFEKLGYLNTGDAVSMKCDLWNYVMSHQTRQKIDHLKDEGIVIKPFTKEYTIKLLHFLDVNFGAGWKRNALMAMQNDESHDTIFISVDKDDNILGFVMRKIDGNDARFGPIGVLESIRSKGLGGLLLETMMEDLKKREIYEMYFLWTHGAAMRFYERHGFDVFRGYDLYRKGLSYEI